MNSDWATDSPFFVEDVDAPHSAYWAGRRDVADAVRELIDAVTAADIPAEEATTISEQIRTITRRLGDYRQLRGVLAHAEAHGSLPVANHEILCVGGYSHPIAPGLRQWLDGDIVRGQVRFSGAYEGPPNHTHGGWVAAVFDHFMGMSHMRLGKPGMTGGLEVRYVKPTPLGKVIDLSATVEPAGGRKTRVFAEMTCEGEVTATAEATFIQPKHMIFHEGEP